MTELHTTIEIDQPRSAVWDVLADFESYERWNPYLSISRGEPRAGAAVEVHITPSRRPDRTETGKITTCEPGSSLRWESVALYSVLYHSTHRFELSRLDEERTRFENRIEYGGILAPLVADDDLEDDLAEMNHALAAYVENGTR